MLTRTADDVWSEIRARCLRLMRTRTPLPTLSRGTQNLITAVEATQIRRRSESPRGGDEDSPVAAQEISAIWDELTHDQETKPVHVLRFAYALVGRLVDGIGFQPEPFRLEVVNEELANLSWRSRLLEGAELSVPREQLLNAARTLKVYREGDVQAPHKPLLLLLALAGYANGTAPRWLGFEEIEGRLGQLIARFSTLSPEIEPQEPFWRLKTSGVWKLAADEDIELQASSPPGVQLLRSSHVRGGFTNFIDAALWSDEALADEAVAELLDAHFPADLHDDLRRAVGIAKDDDAEGWTAAAEPPRGGDLHLLLRWQPARNSDAVELHRQVAESEGAVWWGKIGASDRSALSVANLARFRQQIASGTPTHVYLYRPGEIWRTDLEQLEVDQSQTESSLVPSYYGDENHHLWLKLSNFTELSPDAVTGLVFAATGNPLRFTGRGSLYLVREVASSVASAAAGSPERYFIFNTGAQHHQEEYGDILGERLGFDGDVIGKNLLLDAGQGGFIYYRTGKGTTATPSSFIGSGRIANVIEEDPDPEGKRRWAATLDDYQPFPTAVPRSTYAPKPWSFQHGIAEISREAFEHIVALGTGTVIPTVEFTAAALEEAGVAEGLRIEPVVYHALVAALDSGKHVILTGPPGTAKTTLAEVTARLARRAGRCKGHRLTTATADWTTYETIGGLSPSSKDNGLVFRPGHFLVAATEQKWLVIDELNRSNFDRAFGQMFTVLSGQSVTLPYEDEETGKPIAIVMQDDPNYTDDEYSVVRIAEPWRIVATMNVFDKSLLFEMSFALMRRFAFVEVPAPADDVYRELWAPILKSMGPTLASDAAPVLSGLLAVRKIKEVGPATFLDMARFASAAGPSLQGGRLAYQLFYSYLLPQFEGIDAKQGRALYSAVAPLVGADLQMRLRATLHDVLGVTVSGSQSVSAEEPPEVDTAP